MLISIDWIKDFVNLPNDLTPDEIGNRFTMATAEVEGVITIGEFFEKIRVCQITEIEKHPEADKLNLVTFNYGEAETKRVVCGAANVKVGLKVPYAPLGVSLPNGLTLEPKKIRGILSEGMLCSEEELGYAEESAGLMELPEDAPIGQNLIEYFKETKDVLLDVDNKSLTHRPDLWGMYGHAREFATVFDLELKNPFSAEWSNKIKASFSSDASPVKPFIEGETSCLGYFGLSIDGVKVCDSPDWMKRRLNAVGLRPINNIVDISNYVMLELGIPNHIFDREEIKGDKIIIRHTGKEETFTTLDEEERKLVASDTMICDSERELCIAGIMGGLNSGVTEKTSKIFIEVANWKAAEVRRTSTRLGLRTDASQRYEKTLDTQLLERTVYRIVELVKELCPEAKVIGQLEYDGVDLSTFKNLVLTTSAKKISNVLGKEIPTEQVKKILTSLDFSIIEKGDEFEVIVPSYRSTKDIDCEADLVEEIGRVIGYDNIEPSSPMLTVAPVRLTEAQKLHRKVRDFLSYHSTAFEVNTYPMVGEKLLKKADWKRASDLELINSLSKDHEFMRDSMIPGFLESVALNCKNMDEFRFFELGRTYHDNEKTFSEEHSELGVVFYSKEETPFVDLVNNVERLMSSLNIPGDISERHPKFKNNLIPEEWKGCHPFEFYNIRIMGKMNGVIASIHPLVLRSFKIKGHVSIALLDLTAVEKQSMKDKTKYKPLAKFPGSTFDCTVVTNKDVAVGNVLSSLKKVKIKELASLKVVDVFDLNETEKTVTLRVSFIDPEATLSGEFITEASQKIVSTLDKAGYPLKV
jgi:phenylalanyl-tRNA synthetase beta chain